jgi:hypothetical protein
MNLREETRLSFNIGDSRKEGDFYLTESGRQVVYCVDEDRTFPLSECADVKIVLDDRRELTLREADEEFDDLVDGVVDKVPEEEWEKLADDPNAAEELKESEKISDEVQTALKPFAKQFGKTDDDVKKATDEKINMKLTQTQLEKANDPEAEKALDSLEKMEERLGRPFIQKLAVQGSLPTWLLEAKNMIDSVRDLSELAKIDVAEAKKLREQLEGYTSKWCLDEAMRGKPISVKMFCRKGE